MSAPLASKTLIGKSDPDGLLVDLFSRHFADGFAAWQRLDAHLKAIDLPFDLKNQIRELHYPPQPALPDGLPSLIYYFVPNSGWGSSNPLPVDPLHIGFVYSGDGIGLNLGCPVRLLRALDALSRLDADDQKELREGLKHQQKHLPTVEELLWLTVWKSPAGMHRGGQVPGGRGDVDWELSSSGFPIYLEAKHRPSDWPRLTDQGTFVPMQGSFLGKVAKKFPVIPQKATLHLAAISAFQNLTKELLELIGIELRACPQVHAVIFRTLVQTTHVISLDAGMRDQFLGVLANPLISEYPTNYAVSFHIEQRDMRVEERAKIEQAAAGASPSGVCCWGVETRIDKSVIGPDPGMYHLDIPSYGPDGEPHFELIPRDLYPHD